MPDELGTIIIQIHPFDQALLKEYVQSIEKIKIIADEVPGIKLSFHIDHLDEKFSISKKMISRQGFEEYRKGNLSQAIALWQALIDIDPNNPDIIKALNTAKLQQKNLQK